MDHCQTPNTPTHIKRDRQTRLKNLFEAARDFEYDFSGVSQPMTKDKMPPPIDAAAAADDDDDEDDLIIVPSTAVMDPCNHREQ